MPDHLDAQIYEVVQLKGRLAILELPALLNVGIEKIESRIDSVLKKFKSLIRFEDIIMIRRYF
jgi:hypothetical protein